MTPSIVLAMRHRYEQVSKAAEPLLKKPARELSRAEAWILLEYHSFKGEVQLLKSIGTGKEERAPMSTSVAGVTYLHASGNNSGSRLGSAGAYLSASFSPTAEFAIVLYRFAIWLKAKWEASHIIWGGIGAGSGKNASDCHSGGHCVDFYGARTGRGGTLDVGRDWYHRPVYVAGGKTHTRAGSDWWGTENKTTYRLLITRDAEARDPNDKNYWNWQARDFFLDVLEFIAQECNSTGDSPPSQVRAGATLKAGVTFHPDYPLYTSPGRRQHWDHVHFQLGNAIHKK